MTGEESKESLDEAKNRREEGKGLGQTSSVLSRVKKIFRSNLADPGITYHMTL